jgi:hypothetical protein
MFCRTRVERVAAAAKHTSMEYHRTFFAGIVRDMSRAVSRPICCHSCALKRATALLMVMCEEGVAAGSWVYLIHT